MEEAIQFIIGAIRKSMSSIVVTSIVIIEQERK
jgi:hypothetical protein